MKNKVGIITYINSNSNYGQVLQNAALHYYIYSIGYIPETINFDFESIPNTRKDSYLDKLYNIFFDEISIFSHIKRRLNKIKSKNNSLLIEYTQQELIETRQFSVFKNKYIKYSMPIAKYEDLNLLNNESYKAFITGSDQVWAKSNSKERLNAVLLSFVKNDNIKISYAASFGRSKIFDRYERSTFIKELETFSGISCREESGIGICREFGFRNSQLVLDPTLLLTAQEWIKYLNLKDISNKGKRIFIYTLSNNDNRISSLYNYFKSIGYDIDYLCSSKYKDTLSNCELKIEEWIQKIREADFVITNSYHGTIFSVLFHTPFISLSREFVSRKKGGNNRMYSFLCKTNLLDLFISDINLDSIEKLIDRKINWNKADEYIDKMRIKSKLFLKEKIELHIK